MPLSIDRVVFAVAELRKTAPGEDLSVKVRDPLAQELDFETSASNETDALMLRDSILSMRKNNRNDWSLTVRNNSEYDFIRLGDTVRLIYPRFGFENGANFFVKRIAKDQASGQTGLNLYGPET